MIIALWVVTGLAFLLSASVVGLTHFEEQKEEREPLTLAGAGFLLACASACIYMAGHSSGAIQL